MSEHLRALALAAPECEAKEIARHPLWDDEHCEKAAAELLRLCTQVGALNAEIADHEKAYALLFKECGRLRNAVDAVEVLIGNSDGVSGLHLNGDIAPWESLRTGGRFESWLMALDDAAKGESND